MQKDLYKIDFSNFYIQLLIITLISAAILFGINQIELMAPYFWFSWICLGFFILFTLAMYYFGSKSAKSENKNEFTNVVVGFMAGKMFLAAMTILMYSEIVQPTSKIFILPFFIVYIIYTAFETYFMMKVGKDSA